MNLKFELGSNLILSIFPGIDLLGKAFEQSGFCVVRGPDPLWGGDIRQFTPPSGKFLGVIGGPPCQDFSKARRAAPTGYGLEMLQEFRRVVECSQPEWWLMENVPGVPNLHIPGYHWQRFDVDLAWYCNVSRPRVIQFGSLSGRLLNVTRQEKNKIKHRAALASDNRSFEELCQLQGLPTGFDLPGLTVKAKKRVVGNGVPLQIGRVLATAIKQSYSHPTPVQLSFIGGVVAPTDCVCGCGRPTKPGSKYAVDATGSTQTHRKTYQRNKAKNKCDLATQNGINVTVPGIVTN